MAKKAFDAIFLEAVDEALSSLGESAKQSIYFHLEDKFEIAKDDIPSHVKNFANGLERIFGVGARFIEILIMKSLFGKIGQPLNWDEGKELVFIDYVQVAKDSYSKTREHRRSAS